MRTLYGYNTLTNRVDYSFSTSDEVIYENFQILSENIICLIFENAVIDSSTIYVKDNLIKTRSIQTDENYFWNNTIEAWELDLVKLKTSKSLEIIKNCETHIVSGFFSNALDANHFYPSNRDDQLNLNGTIQRSSLPGVLPTDDFLFLCMSAANIWDYRAHNPNQIQKVGKDAYSHILNARVKNASLQAQINTATTKSELDAIKW